MTEDELTPMQELFIEVLAARTRLGEHFWTFGSRRHIVKTANELERAGLIFTMGGQVERTFRAGLTDEGKRMVLHDTYVPPVMRVTNYRRLENWIEEGKALLHDQS